MGRQDRGVDASGGDVVSVIATARGAALKHGFDPAAVAAIVEVESGGAPFGPDGRPIILYEPHVAWRVATPTQQAALAQAGLAYRKWGEQPYPKQQADRWRQFDRCAFVASRAVAIQACSWGVGQVLGENWRMLGFSGPERVFDAAQTVEGQVDLMVRFLRGAGLTDAVNALDWRTVARRYNGPGQVDRYAALMERAYDRQRVEPPARTAPAPTPRPVEPVPAPPPADGFWATVARFFSGIFGRS